MKKFTLVLCSLLMSIGLATAQNLQVTGNVTSADDNEPVIGASIIVKGTATGTVTDFDGNFTLEVPSNSKVLVISYIGMKSQEVKAGRNLRIVMEPDMQALDEVVVTGYGVTRKAAFTGSAQVVDNKVITKTTNADPIQSLSGSVAGLQLSSDTGQPGGFNSVMIRGLSSFNSGTQPLYVVDGMPITSGKQGMRSDEDATINPLATLNPNDIESVSVLKDATATSIYGARAANGVVVITTKQGKAGKTKFNFSTKVGTSSLQSIGDYRHLGRDNWYDYISIMAKNNGYVDETGVEAGKAFAMDADGLGLSPDGSDTNWFDEVTRNGFTQEYNLDISGGTKALKYFMSAGYYDETGVVIGKDLKRYSGRLNIENTVSKYVTIGINTMGSYTKMNNGAGGGYFSDPITQAYMQLPIFSPFKEDGSYNFDTANGYNPVAQRSDNGDKNIGKQVKLTVSPWIRANYKDFTFSSRYGLDYYNVKEFGLWSMMQPQGRDMNMLGEQGNDYTTMWTWTNTLNYIHAFEDHHVNVLLGQEAQHTTLEGSYLSGSNYPGDMVTTVENAAKPGDAATYISENAMLSYFANAEYDYKDKYYASASFRRDGSSRFGADRKWANFWSAGAKYRFATEEFMDFSSDWLTNGTIRASYGTTGNSELSNWYQALGLYGLGYNYRNEPGMIPTQVENKDLAWEKTKKFNVGAELGFFNKVSVDFDYYINTTTDMLFEVPLSFTTGFSSIMQNVGEMQNKGIELVVNYNPITTKNFRWDVTLNLTHNKNEIVALSTDNPIENPYTIREAGHPYNQFKMKEYAGVDPATGEQLYYLNETGDETTTSYNDAAKRYLGTADPDVYGGLSNNFRLYDFDFSFQLFYSLGGKVYNSAARYDENTHSLFANTTEYIYENFWREPGDITDVPAPQHGLNHSHSSRYLMDGSYLKLKTMQLGYTLPKGLLSQTPLTNVRVYVSGDNLYTWALGSDFRGLNPETSSTGIIWWNYPPARKVMFGLNVSF